MFAARWLSTLPRSSSRRSREGGRIRRWLAGVIDIAVPLACFALAWPLAIFFVTGAAMFLGLYAAVLLPVPLVLGLLLGVITNEFAFPQARGWTVGMLSTRLRLARASVRGGGLFLRSVVTWVSIPAVYLGAEFARWEIILALEASSRLYGWLIPPNPVGVMVALGWTLMLTYPFRGRPLLDRVAGWQVTHRDAAIPVEPEPRKRGGLPLWVWALVTLTGVVVMLLLALSAMIVALFIQDPGPVARVESDLGNAATALEVYYREEGHYAEEALESNLWGYHSDLDVQLEVYIAPGGQSYCLEGFHLDSTARISTYDSVDGLDREATC